MIKKIFPLLIFLILSSCSSNDDEVVSTSIDYFTEDFKNFDGSTWTHNKERYNLLDGKYFKRTSTDFFGNQNTFQTNYYNDDGLITDEFNNMEAHYVYNGQQLVSMAYRSNGDIDYKYRRFVAMPANTYYIEVLDASNFDPGAQVTQRFIAVFDANDDVVSVGEDANLDGVVDVETNFTYQNGDLVTAEEPNGAMHNYVYSDAVDSYNAIVEKTYGKKSRRLIFIQEYLDAAANSGLIMSTHVKLNTFESSEYQLLSNHYVKRIYFEINFSGGGSLQSTTQFHFK